MRSRRRSYLVAAADKAKRRSSAAGVGLLNLNTTPTKIIGRKFWIDSCNGLARRVSRCALDVKARCEQLRLRLRSARYRALERNSS